MNLPVIIIEAEKSDEYCGTRFRLEFHQPERSPMSVLLEGGDDSHQVAHWMKALARQLEEVASELERIDDGRLYRTWRGERKLF